MKKNLVNTTASLKVQKVKQLESDIQRENFLRENSTAMISDREYLYLLFALKELNPNSKVLGKTKLGDAIQNFEKRVKKTLKEMDEEEDEGDAEDADAGEEEDVKQVIEEQIVEQVGVNPKLIHDSGMTKTEIEELLEEAKQEEPVKRKRSKRSVR